MLTGELARDVMPAIDASLSRAGQGVDKALAVVAPGQAVARRQSRQMLARYEGAQHSRLRSVRTDNSSGDVFVGQDGATLRATARYLERNHDIARGALSVLVRNIVGPDGIGVEFAPRRRDGTVDERLSGNLNTLWREWTKRPEVTRSRGWASACRLACRSWLRDGEMFSQLLAGNVRGLDHGTVVPFSLELLEADLVPLDYDLPGSRIRQGVERNAWGRHMAYHVYKSHPGDLFPVFSTLYPSLKRISAERMVHPFMSDRISQTRGVSLFASVITRLQDIKDYEESERVAAKVAASMAAYIRKGDAAEYGEHKHPDERRNLRFQAGMIFDDLGPGEDVGTIDTQRPNQNAADWRNDQLRAVSAGTETGHSSVSHRYDGSYSAQRQELVEQHTGYRVLGDEFVGQFIAPIVERFVFTAAAAGNIRVPRDIDVAQLADAKFRMPPMPWVDPAKEGMGLKLHRENGTRSVPQMIRERGEDWKDVARQQAEYEQYVADQRRERGLPTQDDPTRSN